MKKIILLICIALAGCSERVRPADFQNAERLCSSNGGVDFMWVGTVIDVRCANGALFERVGKASK